MDYFSQIALICFSLQILIGVFFIVTLYPFLSIYRKKKNPEYPILPREVSKYLYKSPKNIFKFYLTPFFIWKIILKHHKDKKLNNAARRVRFSVTLFIIIAILESVLIIVTTPNLNIRLP
jgi:hypothetical protein